jgi:hypothetical protein
LLPYLQYLEQGSASIDGMGISRKADVRVDAMANALMQLEKKATNY